MMSIILALLAALFAAFTAILAKVGIENVNSNLATAHSDYRGINHGFSGGAHNRQV
jgi:uncharacterized membrane protein